MNNIEATFSKFLQAVNILQTALNVPMASAVTETFDNLENGKIKVEMGAPDVETVKKLSQAYEQLDYENLSKNKKYLVFTLLTLKAINDDGRDYSQMPTPQILATVISLMFDKLISKSDITIVDPALGTGSLLYNVVNQLVASHHSQNNYHLVGIDNDEAMLDLADVGAHLNGFKIDLYCQDALESWMVEKSEVILSDLPVGYYPIDENAKNFATHAKEGHSLAHELFVEQVIKNLAPDGYAFLLVPNSLISGKLGSEFMPWLAKKVHLRSIVQLPNDLFTNPLNQKSLMVFQNHGTNSNNGEILLTKLDSLKKEKSLFDFSQKLNEWYNKMR